MEQPEIREPRAPLASQGDGKKQTITAGSDLRIEEDQTTRALLAAILREQRKHTLILLEAFKSELGGLTMEQLELEV